MKPNVPASDFTPIGMLKSAGQYEIHIREDGPSQGPPIVLIHGFLGSMRWFDRLVPLLSHRFRVIRADLLGHGFSSKPHHGYSPENQARVLSLLLNGLGVVDPIVVGHSMGADIAISLAEQGTKVSKLVVVDEAPDYSVADPSAINKVLRLPVLGRLLYRNLPTSAHRRAVEGFLAPGRSLAATFDDVAQTVNDVGVVPYACFVGSQVEKERFVAQQPLDERIAALGVATLVIFGEQDRVFRSGESCVRYRAVPGIAVQLVPEVGHSPMIEDPVITAEIIHGFIA
ncbi:alpha/beta fold hydrolase [Streptomyces sp. NBC_00996]|uniref:alpha/beta fold hydrolase n=1 Tax=Streptomyces sp. NBC_00996 TaxID=2903710 RepID=UPI00386A8A74|nr:alpha/beta hydrolase [Streptomyces sp. NBC_00996]